MLDMKGGHIALFNVYSWMDDDTLSVSSFEAFCWSLLCAMVPAVDTDEISMESTKTVILSESQ